MGTKKTQNPAEFIVPLYMNGLQGRMLRMPPPKGKKREILFVYGHHSTIERWWGVAQDLNKYGGITMPDLPGFGGMQSFYKIGEKPDLDTMADYLAAFIKLRYAHRRVTILGMSYGFLVVTRMLQKYPDLVKRVDLLFSAVGFAHRDDFRFSNRSRLALIALGKFLLIPPARLFFRNVILHPAFLRIMYAKTPNARHKMKGLDKETTARMLDFEVVLWHKNDVRTHWATSIDMLRADNCAKRVNLPVYHISVKDDQWLDHTRIEQHMRVIFNDYHEEVSKMSTHAPSVIADASEAAPLIPARYRRMLAKQP